MATHVAAARAKQPKPGTSAGVVTVLLTSVAYFMVALDTLVVVTALPSIHRDLGGNVDTLQWTVNAYVLAFGATIITAADAAVNTARPNTYIRRRPPARWPRTSGRSSRSVPSRESAPASSCRSA